MVTLVFTLGRDTRTPITVQISEESAEVAMHHFETVFNNYIRISNDDGSNDEGTPPVPGIGTNGSFNIN